MGTVRVIQAGRRETKRLSTLDNRFGTTVATLGLNTVHFLFNGKPQATVSALNSRLRLAVKQSRRIEAEKRTVLRLGLLATSSNREFTCSMEHYYVHADVGADSPRSVRN